MVAWARARVRPESGAPIRIRAAFTRNLYDAPTEPPDGRLDIPGISLSSADDEFSLGDDDAVSLSLAAASA
jgi:hypothetical protein